jgi:hypothetical protein
MSNGIEFSYASEETFKIVTAIELRALDLLIEALKPRIEEDRYARRAVEDLEAVRRNALKQATTLLRLKLEQLEQPSE